jgi:signal transduction histidine kinase
MNLEHAQPDRATRPQSTGHADTRLHGGWLILAHVTWGVVVVLVLGLFLVSLPTYLTYLQTVCVHQPCPYQQLTVNSVQSLQALGISVEGYAALTLTLTLGTALVWVVMGGLLVWRRSDDWMALLVAFMLVVGGANNGLYGGFTTSQAGWQAPANLLGFLFSLALFVVFSLFPSGHFAPRWIRWLIPAFLLNNFLYQFFTNWYAHLPGWASFLGLLDFVGSLLLLVLAQIYRYWRVSTPVQRQQTKWILFSLTVGIVSMLGWIFLESFFPSLNGSLYDPVNAYLNDLGSLLFPISFAIAIMRYRLWDIDIIINRTLVYGALTASIIGMYILVVGYLGALFRTGNNLLISLIATGLVAALFQPLRELLQRGVNRLFYGQRDEPYRVVSRLGQRLEATLAPEAVLPTIVETVAQALKLPYAAITLQQDGAVVSAAIFGKEPGGGKLRPYTSGNVEASLADALIHLPLIYQTEQIGELLLAPRGPGESFTPADRALLSDLARQAVVAAHAVRLTTDLQRLAGELQQSRTELVTTREEERRRLRRDLHDGLGSALTSVTFQLDAASNLLDHDPQAVRTLLMELKGQMQASIADIRQLVYNLRPPILDEWGLVAALREQVAQYQLNQVQVTVDAPESLPALPAAVEVAAYRIALEALANVIRHAQATRCTICLAVCDDALTVEVQDNGKGLSSDYHAGVGISAMRERAAELGGSCVIEDVAAGGTRVYVRLPLLKE